MNLFKYILVILVLASCHETIRHSDEQEKTLSVSTPDTIIGSRPITNEIAGSAYRKRATGYFVIIGTDTSDYMPIFIESKKNGHVILDLHLPYYNDNLTFDQHLCELNKILSKASTEYDFDYLTGISIGRLILTGDLAIKVTDQYKEKFGEPGTIKTDKYNEISNFLKESQLANEFNNLFQPFSLTVDHIGVEKVFFAHKDELLKLKIKTKTDTSEIPDKILDCLTGVGLKKE